MSPRVILVIGLFALALVAALALWAGTDAHPHEGRVDDAPAPRALVVPAAHPSEPATVTAAPAPIPAVVSPTDARPASDPPLAVKGMAPMGAPSDAGDDEWALEAANVFAATKALEEAVRRRGAR